MCFRWFGQSRLASNDLTEIDDPFVAKLYKSKQAETNSDGHLSEPEKYHRAQQAFGRIGGELIRFSDDDFGRALSAFDQWWHAAIEQENILPKDRDDDVSGGGTSTKDSEFGGCGGYACATGQPSSGDEDVAPTQPTESRADHQPVDNTSSGKSSNALEIRLTGDIRRVGRPKSNRAKLKEKAKVALKEYNKGMKLRGLLRDKDVCDVVATILEIKPGVNELGSYLATMQNKTKTPAKVFQWRVDPDFIPEESGVGYRNLYEGEQAPTEDTFVVAIEKAGEFKRDQLEGMQWLWNMQAVCRNAVLCCA
ncbi:hypothetical protein GQ600_24373 [Phytophthora cactorum]|nr:hypothetical protein GQ600_24373 [Phytophthora cactorum]